MSPEPDWQPEEDDEFLTEGQKRPREDPALRDKIHAAMKDLRDRIYEGRPYEEQMTVEDLRRRYGIPR